VETLAQIAFDLSRKWKARPTARFTRFTLGLIAVQAPLDGMSREQAKGKLRASIEDFARNPRAERVAAGIRALAESAKSANILTAPVAETIKVVLPPLIQTISGKPLNEAKHWHADIPEAEGASPLDALVSLNQRAHAQPAEMTAWLTAAFLADVRENHPRMAVPDPKSPCACDNPDKLRHWHNWVLLLDNIDNEVGKRFVTDLLAARQRHLRRRPDDHDALLIIAASGRWNPDWESGWRAPWKPSPGGPDSARTVPQCRGASYEHWASGPASELPQPMHYPVLLEPLSIDETAQIMGTSQYASESELAQRATGGLPGAVHLLARLVRDRRLRPGSRDVLRPSDPSKPGADLWRDRLDDARIAQHLPDIGIDEFVTAAPFATAPWLVPAEAASLISRPHVGRILTELRTALWVTAPTHGGGTPDYAELHPWIARTLVCALAARDAAPNGPSYTAQFEALLNDPDTLGDPSRNAYCQLALGQISEVVNSFEASFDRGPHQEWIDRLKLVARAPDNKPLDQDCAELYRELVNADISNTPQGRTPVGNIFTRLVAASWLAANPFAMPDPDQKVIIVHAYGELPPLSRRPDVAALYMAAQLAAGTLL